MSKLCIIFLFLILAGDLVSAQEKFNIVFLTDVKYAQDSTWVQKIKNDWGATAANFRIYMSSVDKLTHCSWDAPNYNVDKSLKILAGLGLNIYIRASMCYLNSNWVDKVFNDSDFDIRSNGERFLNHNDPLHRPILNLESDRSKSTMLNFLEELVHHLDTLPENVRSKIKLIVPTISPDDETEYPVKTWDANKHKIIWGSLTGFSKPEISAFMNYLKSKYNNIEALNAVWGSNFKSIDTTQIKIKDYNWDYIKTDTLSSNYYKYVSGRKDFLDFRRQELTGFINNCSKIVRKGGFKFGIQLSCIYDTGLEFNGFYDPTPLLQNVDYFITDDVVEYYPNLDFSADYSRSLCKYWEWFRKDSSKISFATETDWPGYNGHTPKNLTTYWSKQLYSFYSRGASALFISGWGSEWDGVANEVIKGTLKNYENWADTLKKHHESVIKNIVNQNAVHLGCEQGLYLRRETPFDYIHNIGKVVYTLDGKNVFEFPLYEFSKPLEPYINQHNEYYRGHGDFVTNYMIEKSPEYLFHYKNLELTATSVFISDSAYSNILKNNAYSKYQITDNTWYTENGLNKFAFIPGARNEYGIIRSHNILLKFCH